MARALCAELFCVALRLATLASAVKTREKDPPPYEWTSCAKNFQHLQVGSLSRDYALHAPHGILEGGKDAASRDKYVRVPLVIGFHCSGCSGLHFEEVQAIADAGILVAIPIGIGLSWNAEVCCGQALSENIDDVGFVKALLDTLLDSSFIVPGVRVESQAVYAWGHSNGGFLSSHLMKALPGYFRGAVSVSGHIYNMTGMSTPKAISIHVGLKDPVVDSTGCCTSQACCCGISQAQGQSCHGAEELFANWLEINSCSSGQVSRQGLLNMSCKEGINCTRPTQLCSRREGDHYTSWEKDGAHIAQFLARDICSIHGTWDINGTCTCNSGSQGPLCLD